MRSSRGEMRGARRATPAAGAGSRSSRCRSAASSSSTKLAYRSGPTRRSPSCRCRRRSRRAPTIEITFKFTAQLPEVFARTGYKGEFHLVGQWFPKIGVRVGPPGAERWECQPLHVHTEFFADFGTYDVSLTVPSTYVVAATGVLVAAIEAPGGTRTLTYRAEDVHDFAWMADPYMEVMSGPGEGRGRHGRGPRLSPARAAATFARRHLAAGIGAIERFSAWFVPYPWPIMSIVDPPVDAMLGAGGMEYPTLVTTAGDTVFARPGLRLPEYVTVHEVGHNWFQGILASNEAIEAWLDEGVNEWADAKVMSELYGARAQRHRLDGLAGRGRRAPARGRDRSVRRCPSPIATAAYAFVDCERVRRRRPTTTTARALATLEQTRRPGEVRGGDEGVRADVGVQAPDRPRPVRHAVARARPGPDLVLRPGVPPGRRLELGIRTADVPDRAPAARRVRRGRRPQDGDRGRGARHRHATCARSSSPTPAPCTSRSTSSSRSPTARRSASHWDDRGNGTLGAVRARAQLAAGRGPARSRPQARARDRRCAITTGSRATARPRCAPPRGSQRSRRRSCRSWGRDGTMATRLGLGDARRRRRARAVALHRDAARGVRRAEPDRGACMVAIAVVLAQAFAHLPMFDEAVDGDLVALIWCLRHARPSLLAIGGIVFGALAAVAARVVVPRRRPVRRARERPESRGDTARCFGASGAATYLAYARLALCSLPGWALVLFVFGGEPRAGRAPDRERADDPAAARPARVRAAAVGAAAPRGLDDHRLRARRADAAPRHPRRRACSRRTCAPRASCSGGRSRSSTRASAGCCSCSSPVAYALPRARPSDVRREGAVTLFVARQGVALLRLAIRVG